MGIPLPFPSGITLQLPENTHKNPDTQGYTLNLWYAQGTPTLEQG
jgi:hypothetical protein